MESISIHTDSANLTEEQFFRLCNDNKELRIERNKDKNIIIMSPTGANTGKYNMSIAVKLWLWNEKQKLGYCFDSSTGFTLPDSSVRSPDAAWISKERWANVNPQDKKRFAHICPDFVIELLSETDSLKNLQEKMQQWINNGCQLAWLIDMESHITYIYKPNMKIVEQQFIKTLSGENILPDFELMLSTIIDA